jgi:hypothetical protein
MDPTVYGTSKEEYEKLVKQPMDLGTVRTKLDQPPESVSSYKSVSAFSKDVNRVFSNVMKVWDGEDEIVLAARRLQSFWVEKWTELVPRLMTMKTDSSDTAVVEATAADSRDSYEDILEACAKVNNDRGDDYQEQIGMPDEENMRHWSHHHTTDTVDDPVFRAAMRGCDAVSFVFGLEVTWSLIQQRQQEEEELVALQELNCVQEGDDEGDKDGDEDEREGNCNPSDTATESPEYTEEGITDMDVDMGHDNHSHMKVDAEGSPAATSEPGEVMYPRGDNSVVLTSETKNSTKSNRSDATLETGEFNGTSTVADVDVLVPFAGQRGTSNVGREYEQTQTTSDEWPCSACTFSNPRPARKCQICATAKPRLKKRSICELNV